jgi:proline racemase
MRCVRILNVVDCYWVRVVVGGIPYVAGSTLQEKSKYIKDHLDYLRTSLVYEPRGSRGKIACIITAPASPNADLGLIFMGWGGYYDMCGGAIIGAGTVALTTGILEVKEPITSFTFETPAGLIPVKATIEGGKVREISFQNVFSSVTLSGQTLPFKELKIPFDLVNAGNRFCIVNAEDIGIDVVPENTNRLASIASEIIQWVNTEASLQPSQSKKKPVVDLLQISQILDKKERRYRNINIASNGAIDLSPCGTGTCAKMALFHSKGELSLGETIVNEGLNGERFKGRIVETKKSGLYQGVIPEISGAAYITGLCHLIIDPDDPFKHGIFRA